MSDVQALTASIGGDAAQFIAAMQQSAAMFMQMLQAQQQAAAAAQQVAQATAQQESAVLAAAAAARESAAAAKEAAAAYNSDWSEAIKENTALQREAADAAKEAARAEQEAKAEAAENMQKLADLAGLATGFALVEKGVELLKEFAVETIDAAAAAQMIGVRFQSAFGVASDEVAEWAETAGQSLGRSKDDMMELATSAKVMAEGLGMSSEASTDAAQSIAKLAVEMSIARGVPLDEAMQRLNAGLHGMGRGLYEFGIALNATTQSQEAMREGLGDSYSKLTQAQQAQVNFNIIMAQSGKLADDAAAASGTYTNQVASLKSSWEEMTAHLGAAALPALTSLVEMLNTGVKAFDGLKDSTKGWILSLAWGPVGAGVSALKELYNQAKQVIALAGGGPDPAELQRQAMYAVAQQQQAQNDAEKKHFDELVAEGEAARAKKAAEDEKAAEDLKKISDQVDAARLKAAQEYERVVHQALQDVMTAQQAADKQHAAEVESTARKQLEVAKQVYQLQHQAAEEQLTAAEQTSSTARNRFQSASGDGSIGEIDQARRAMDAAQTNVQSAFQTVQDVDAKHIADLKTQLDTESSALQGQYQAQQDANDNLSAARLQLETDIGDKRSAAQLEMDQQELKGATEAANQASKIYNDTWNDIRTTQDGIVATQKDANENHKKSIKEAAEYQAALQRAVDAEHKKLLSIGMQGIGSIGSSMLQGAQTGFAAGGAGGAAVGAAAALLQASQGFQDMAAAFNKVFQSISNTIGSILEPIVPVLNELGGVLDMVLKPLGVILGEVGAALVLPLQIFIQAIQPLVQVVADLLYAIGPIIGPIAQLVAIFSMLEYIGILPLIPIVQGLADVLGAKGVGGAIQKLIEGIAGIWNGIIGLLQTVLQDIAGTSIFGAHPFGFLADLASDLNGAKIDVSGFDAAVNAGTGAVNQFSAALAQATQQAVNSYQKDVENVGAIESAMKLAQQEGNTDVYNELKKELGQAQAQTTQDFLQMLIAISQQEGGQLQGNSAGEMINGQLTNVGFGQYAGMTTDQLQAQLALLEASNTVATSTNTTALNNLNATLTNAPSGFVAAAYEVMAQTTSAAAAASGKYGSAAQAQAAASAAGVQGALVIQGDVHLQLNGVTDVDDLMTKLEGGLRKIARNRGGLPVLGGAGRFGS